MIIKDLQLDHFGKFHDTELHLGPGINVIYGPNESGKSTMHSFIQCMLFDAEKLRGKAALRDTYSRFQPWDQMGSYAGRMRFEYQGKNYRIIRNFHKSDAMFTVIDETTGMEVVGKDGEISDLISDLTPVNYRNSVSIGQMSLQPDNQFAGNMQTFLANMAMSGDESVDVEKALAYLKAERKKVNAQISEEDYQEALKAAEALKEELNVKGVLLEEQEKLTKAVTALQKQIKELETMTDEAMKLDRKERIRAIQLVQENNDVADMYQYKKDQLKMIEENQGGQSRHGKYDKIIHTFAENKDRIEDLEARYDELEEQGGNLVMSLALVLPFLALAVLSFMGGNLVGLSPIMSKVVAVVFFLMGLLIAFITFQASDKKRSRMQMLRGEIIALKQKQQKVLDDYGIIDIEELKNRGFAGNVSQETITRLKKELEELKIRYQELQEPLRPYIEKYGESLTLDSDVGQEEKKQLEQLRKKLAELTKAGDLNAWKLEQLEKKQNHLEEIEAQIEQMKVRRQGDYEDLTAIDLAEETIRNLTAQIHRSFGVQFNDYISQLLSAVTNEAHQKLTIDEQFQVRVDDDRLPVLPHQLSAGTADQIYFSVRMAVGQVLFSEPMPLILDDSFVLYDDERLQKTLGWLAGQTAFSQVIIFTCHHREAEILSKMGCPVNYCEIT